MEDRKSFPDAGISPVPSCYVLSILFNGKLRPFWFGVSVVTKILPLLLDTRGQDPESELGVWVCSPFLVVVCI